MKTSYKIIALLCMLAVSAGASAQSFRHKQNKADTVPALVSSYVDSLRLYKAKADSLSLTSATDYYNRELSGEYYRLFAPLTFYNSIARHNFSLDTDTVLPSVDESLLAVYMRRPDLVLGSQSQIEKAGTIVKAEPGSVAPTIDMVEQYKPQVEDTYVEPFDIIVNKPNFWKYSGDFTLQLQQNYFSSNWYQGGESSYYLHAGVALQANYDNKKKFVWENLLELKVGVAKVNSDSVHSVTINGDNLLRYTSKAGIKASKHWKYTLQLIATTQLFKQYKSNDETIYSDFLSPLRVNPSIGMDYTVSCWKGRLTGSVNIAPFAYNMTYCRRAELASSFGIEEGHHFIDDFGSQLTVNLNWKITNDISWSTRLYAYTSYERALVEWENKIRFKVNKYLSSELFVYPRLDDSLARDDHHGYWHFKEYLSFGLAYSI